jgi:hypothetical protein
MSVLCVRVQKTARVDHVLLSSTPSFSQRKYIIDCLQGRSHCHCGFCKISFASHELRPARVWSSLRNRVIFGKIDGPWVSIFTCTENRADEPSLQMCGETGRRNGETSNDIPCNSYMYFTYMYSITSAVFPTSLKETILSADKPRHVDDNHRHEHRAASTGRHRARSHRP